MLIVLYLTNSQLRYQVPDVVTHLSDIVALMKSWGYFLIPQVLPQIHMSELEILYNGKINFGSG